MRYMTNGWILYDDLCKNKLECNEMTINRKHIGQDKSNKDRFYQKESAHCSQLEHSSRGLERLGQVLECSGH